jgi:hypothetical protein
MYHYKIRAKKQVTTRMSVKESEKEREREEHTNITYLYTLLTKEPMFAKQH